MTSIAEEFDQVYKRIVIEDYLVYSSVNDDSVFLLLEYFHENVF